MLCMGLAWVSSAGALVVVPDFGVGEKMPVGNVEFGKPVSPEKINLYLTAQNNQPVNIPDPNLAAVIRRTLGKEKGEVITQADMEKLTSLDAQDWSIRNIAGLEYAINLIELQLQGGGTGKRENDNQISDLTPLANLSKLEVLYLYHNQISDISPLANLTNLIKLDIGLNLISDLSPLANLTKLTELNAEWNKISDLSPLANLTKLTELNAQNNQISDLSPLANLTKLIFLNALDNQISDLSALAGLTKLTSLYLSYNLISDITPLAKLINLEDLNFESNLISDLSPLANLTKLIFLNAQNNQISDLSALAGLTKLNVLFLSYNLISDITPLAKLTYLHQLWLEDNQIGDIQALVDNKGIGDGDRVYLDNNPFDSQPGSKVMQQIQELRNRGVNVSAPLQPHPSSPEQVKIAALIKQEFGVEIVDKFTGRRFDEGELNIILETLRSLKPSERFRGAVTKIEARLQKDRPEAGADASHEGVIKFYMRVNQFFLAHEIGHMVHFGRVNGVTIDTTGFQQLHNNSGPNDFAEDYGKTDWEEDFATIFDAYMVNSSSFTARARAYPILRDKLKIVIEVFREGNMVYTYTDNSPGYNVGQVPVGSDGLPVF